MGSLLGYVVVVTLGVGFVMGLVIWTYYQQQRKRIVYKAQCYHLMDGIKPLRYDKKGNVVSNIKLKELRPYMIDTLQVTEQAKGITIYNLVKQGITTGEVKAKHIEDWGKNKFVRVLVDGKSATLLDSGYDETTGSIIFSPMSRERIDLVTSQIELRKLRNKVEEKNILQALFPWIATFIIGFFMFASAWTMGNAHLKAVEMSEKINEAQLEQHEKIMSANAKMVNTQRDMINELTSKQKDINSNNLKNQNIPSIE